MTTLDDLVETIRTDYLLTGDVETRNRLEGAINSSLTNLILKRSNTGFLPGVRAELGYEDIYIVEGSSESTTIEVERGQFGSIALAQDDDELIIKSPKYSKASIYRAINQEIKALSAIRGLFRMATLELTSSPTRAGYDFDGVDPSEVYSIWEVRAKTPGPDNSWPNIYSYTFSKSMPVSSFPSGMGIIIDEGGHPGLPIVVKYRGPFTPVDLTDVDFDATSTDIAEWTGLDDGALDLISLGVAIRLTVGKEVKRNFTDTQGDTRRAEEVPPGATLQSVGGLVNLREERIRKERQRLATQYPVVTKPVMI